MCSLALEDDLRGHDRLRTFMKKSCGFLKVLTDGLFRGKGLTWGVVFGKACIDAVCLCLSTLVALMSV